VDDEATVRQAREILDQQLLVLDRLATTLDRRTHRVLIHEEDFAREAAREGWADEFIEGLSWFERGRVLSTELRQHLLGLRVALDINPPEARARTAVAAGVVEHVAVEIRKKPGIAGLSTAQLLLIVLTWLVAIGFPMAEAELPVKQQTIAINEAADLGLALAIVDKIKNSGR
jgi:predicted transcriptional regulator